MYKELLGINLHVSDKPLQPECQELDLNMWLHISKSITGLGQHWDINALKDVIII